MKKKSIFLCGSAVLPLKIGERALVLYDGEISGTAPVESIGPIMRGRVSFETAEAAYCLFPIFPPQNAASAVAENGFGKAA